nr:J21 [uncultured bacterium]
MWHSAEAVSARSFAQVSFGLKGVRLDGSEHDLGDRANL